MSSKRQPGQRSRRLTGHGQRNLTGGAIRAQYTRLDRKCQRPAAGGPAGVTLAKLELSPEAEALFDEVDRIYLEQAHNDPRIWTATTAELQEAYDSAVRAVESGALQGEELLEALGWIDLLEPVLRTRYAQRDYCGRGGVPA